MWKFSRLVRSVNNGPIISFVLRKNFSKLKPLFAILLAFRISKKIAPLRTMDDKANRLVAKLCALCQELKNIDFAVEEPINEDTLCEIILKEIQRVKYKYDECRNEFLESNLFHSGFNDVDIDFKRIFFEAMGKLVKYRKNEL